MYIYIYTHIRNMHIQYIYYTYIKYQIVYKIILDMIQFLSNLLDPFKTIQKIWVFECSRMGMRTFATATFLILNG